MTCSVAAVVVVCARPTSTSKTRVCANTCREFECIWIRAKRARHSSSSSAEFIIRPVRGCPVSEDIKPIPSFASLGRRIFSGTISNNNMSTFATRCVAAVFYDDDDNDKRCRRKDGSDQQTEPHRHMWCGQPTHIAYTHTIDHIALRGDARSRSVTHSLFDLLLCMHTHIPTGHWTISARERRDSNLSLCTLDRTHSITQ